MSDTLRNAIIKLAYDRPEFRADLLPLVEARYEEGKPADPTENMSEEDAQKWEDMTDKYEDKFKKASDKTSSSVDDVEMFVEMTGRKPQEGKWHLWGLDRDGNEVEMVLEIKSKGFTLYREGVPGMSMSETLVRGENTSRNHSDLRRALARLRNLSWDRRD